MPKYTRFIINREYVLIDIKKSELYNSHREVLPNSKSRGNYLLLIKKLKLEENGKKALFLKEAEEKDHFSLNPHPVVRKYLKSRIKFKVDFAKTLINLKENDKITCFCCKKSLSAEDASIDHFIPKSRGGTDDVDNLVLMCRSCNQIKGSICPKNEPTIINILLKKKKIKTTDIFRIPSNEIISLYKKNNSLSLKFKIAFHLKLLLTPDFLLKRNEIEYIENNMKKNLKNLIKKTEISHSEKVWYKFQINLIRTLFKASLATN